MQAVCWKWQRDDGGYCPYLPEDSSTLETAHASGNGQCTLGQYVVDFKKLIQHRKAGGGKRKIQRVAIQLPAAPSIEAYWMWAEYPGQFVPYDIDASVDIELAFKRGEGHVDLTQKPSKLPYTIDLGKLFQTRHYYNTRRAIQRAPLPTGTSLQQLLRPALVLPPTASSSASYLGSGAGLVSGVGPYHVGSSLAGATPTYAGNGSAASYYGMPGATPIPNSYRSGATAFASSGPHLSGPYLPGPPGYHLGHLGHAPGHTPRPTHSPSAPSSTYITPATSFHISSSTTSKSGTSSALSSASRHSSAATPSSSSSSLLSNPPAAATRSKAGSRKTAAKSSAALAAPRTAASVPKKSSGKSAGKGKSRAKKVAPTSAGVHGGGGGDLSTYARRVTKLRPKADEPCPICMNKLSEQSGFEDDDDALPSAPCTLNVYRLRKCGHKLHLPCLNMYVKSCSKGGFQCPTCKRPYGVKMGDMPDGSMSVRNLPSSLPGHEGCGTIQISYNFSAGYYNGKHYRANGFPRTCYLPNSAKGQKVLKLLKVAWERRLTFTIGTSVTTGAADTVVWNEIHHKTESHSNHSGHGYPDPHYLDRVMLELVAQGVTEDEEEEEEDAESSESSEDEEEHRCMEPQFGTRMHPISTHGSDDSL